MKNKAVIWTLIFIATGVGLCSAEEAHHHHHSEHHEGVLHFSHPIGTESPTPETHVRFDYSFESVGDGEPDAQSLTLGGEYAFSPALSLEFGVPYVMQSGGAGDNLGNVDIGMKFANPVWADRGILMAYGLEVILPTGDDEKGIGSEDEVEFEPFFGFGYQSGDWEFIAFTAFGIPVNVPEDEDTVNELTYSASILHFLSPEFRALLEVEGTTLLNGEDDGETVVNLLPGVSFSPGGGALWWAVHVGFPVTGRQDYDLSVQTSVIRHF